MMHTKLYSREELVTILTGLTVEEVSIVDEPANGRRWIVKNAISEAADGTLVIEEASAESVTASKLAESTFQALGALEKALANPESAVCKALDVNEGARAEVWPCFDYIHDCMTSIGSLLSCVDGTPFSGSLDHAVGSELCRIAYKFVELGRLFGVDGMSALNEMHSEMYPDGEPEPAAPAAPAPMGLSAVQMAAKADVEKGNRSMSASRLHKMAGVAGLLNEALEDLLGLYVDAGGPETLLSEVRAMRYGDRAEKSDRSDLDSKLSEVVTVLSEGQGAILDTIKGMRVNTRKSIPSSSQLTPRPVPTPTLQPGVKPDKTVFGRDSAL